MINPEEQKPGYTKETPVTTIPDRFGKSPILRYVSNKHAAGLGATNVVRGTTQPDYFGSGLLTNSSDLPDWQRENLSKIEQEKKLEAKQEWWEKNLFLVGNAIGKIPGYLVQMPGHVQEIGSFIGHKTGLLEGEQTSLTGDQNPFIETGKAMNEWVGKFMPFYKKNPEMQNGVDWKDYSIWAKGLSDVAAQVPATLALGGLAGAAGRGLAGAGLRGMSYLAKGVSNTDKIANLAKASGMLYEGSGVAASTSAMAAYTGQQGRDSVVSELREKYETDREFFKKLYGTDDPKFIEHEINKAGDVAFIANSILGILTSFPLARLLPGIGAKLINKTREGITNSFVPTTAFSQLGAPMIAEGIEEWGEHIGEKAGTELLNQRGEAYKKALFDQKDPRKLTSEELDKESSFVKAMKDSFVKNAFTEEAAFSAILGMFGGGAEVAALLAKGGGEDDFRTIASDKKAINKFFNVIRPKLDDGDNSIGGILGRQIESQARMLYQMDNDTKAGRDSFENLVMPISTGLDISLEHRGFDVYKQQLNNIREAIDHSIKGTLDANSTDPNMKEYVRILETMSNDPAFIAMVNGKDDSEAKDRVKKALIEQKSHLDVLANSADGIRDRWSERRQQGWTKEDNKAYLDNEIRGLLFDNITNNDEVKSFIAESKVAEDIRKGIDDRKVELENKNKARGEVYERQHKFSTEVGKKIASTKDLDPLVESAVSKVVDYNKEQSSVTNTGIDYDRNRDFKLSHLLDAVRDEFGTFKSLLTDEEKEAVLSTYKDDIEQYDKLEEEYKSHRIPLDERDNIANKDKEEGELLLAKTESLEKQKEDEKVKLYDSLKHKRQEILDEQKRLENKFKQQKLDEKLGINRSSEAKKKDKEAKKEASKKTSGGTTQGTTTQPKVAVKVPGVGEPASTATTLADLRSENPNKLTPEEQAIFDSFSFEDIAGEDTGEAIGFDLDELDALLSSPNQPTKVLGSFVTKVGKYFIVTPADYSDYGKNPENLYPLQIVMRYIDPHTQAHVEPQVDKDGNMSGALALMGFGMFTDHQVILKKDEKNNRMLFYIKAGQFRYDNTTGKIEEFGERDRLYFVGDFSRADENIVETITLPNTPTGKVKPEVLKRIVEKHNKRFDVLMNGYDKKISDRITSGIDPDSAKEQGVIVTAFDKMFTITNGYIKQDTKPGGGVIEGTIEQRINAEDLSTGRVVISDYNPKEVKVKLFGKFFDAISFFRDKVEREIDKYSNWRLLIHGNEKGEGKGGSFLCFKVKTDKYKVWKLIPKSVKNLTVEQRERLAELNAYESIIRAITVNLPKDEKAAIIGKITANIENKAISTIIRHGIDKGNSGNFTQVDRKVNHLGISVDIDNGILEIEGGELDLNNITKDSLDAFIAACKEKANRDDSPYIVKEIQGVNLDIKSNVDAFVFQNIINNVKNVEERRNALDYLLNLGFATTSAMSLPVGDRNDPSALRMPITGKQIAYNTVGSLLDTVMRELNDEANGLTPEEEEARLKREQVERELAEAKAKLEAEQEEERKRKEEEDKRKEEEEKKAKKPIDIKIIPYYASNANAVDVTSNAKGNSLEFRELSPFVATVSVLGFKVKLEHIWQGIKVIKGKVDEAMYTGQKPNDKIKRGQPTDINGKPLERGMKNILKEDESEPDYLTLEEAQRTIYIPLYNKIINANYDLIKKLADKYEKEGSLILKDYDTNETVGLPKLSHASLIKKAVISELEIRAKKRRALGKDSSTEKTEGSILSGVQLAPTSNNSDIFYSYGENRKKQLNPSEQALILKHITNMYLSIFTGEGTKSGHIASIKALANYLSKGGFNTLLGSNIGEHKQLIDSITSDLTDLSNALSTVTNEDIAEDVLKLPGFFFIKKIEQSLLNMGVDIVPITLDGEVFLSNLQKYEKESVLEQEEEVANMEEEEEHRSEESFNDDEKLSLNLIKSMSQKVKAFISFIAKRNSEEDSPIKGLYEFYDPTHVINVLTEYISDSSSYEEFLNNIAEIGVLIDRVKDPSLTDIYDRLKKLNESNKDTLLQLYNVFSKQKKSFKIIEVEQGRQGTSYKVYDGGSAGPKNVIEVSKRKLISRYEVEKGNILIPLSEAKELMNSVKSIDITTTPKELDENYNNFLAKIAEDNSLTDEQVETIKQDALIKKGVLCGSLKLVNHRLNSIGVKEITDKQLNGFVLKSTTIQGNPFITTIGSLKEDLLKVQRFYFPEYDSTDLDSFLTLEALGRGSGNNYSNIGDISKNMFYHPLQEAISSYATANGKAKIQTSLLDKLKEQSRILKHTLAPLFSRLQVRTNNTFREGGRQFSELMKHDQISLFLNELRSAKTLKDPIITKLLKEVTETPNKYNEWLVNLIAGKLYTLGTEESIAKADAICNTAGIDSTNRDKIISNYSRFEISIFHQIKNSKTNNRQRVREMSPKTIEVSNLSFFFETLNAFLSSRDADKTKSKSFFYRCASPTASDRELSTLANVPIMDEDKIKSRFENLKLMEAERKKNNRDFIKEKIDNIQKFKDAIKGMNGYEDIADKPFSEHYKLFRKNLIKENRAEYYELVKLENKFLSGFVPNINCKGKDFVSILGWLETYTPESKDIIGLQDAIIEGLDTMTYEQFKKNLLEPKLKQLKKLGIIDDSGKAKPNSILPDPLKNINKESIFLYEANYFFNGVDYKSMFMSLESFKGKDLYSVNVEITKRMAGTTGQGDQFAYTDRNYSQLIIADHKYDLLTGSNNEQTLICNIFRDFANNIGGKSGIKFQFNNANIKLILDKLKSIDDIDEKAVSKSQSLSYINDKGTTVSITGPLLDVIKQSWSLSKDYTSINNTDAQEYQSLEESLMLSINMGYITTEQAKLPPADVLQNGVFRKDPSADNYGEFDESKFDDYKGGLWHHITFGSELSKDNEKLGKNNTTNYVMKTVYTDHEVKGKSLVFNYIKSSTLTLSPVLTKGLPIDKVRKLMNLTGIPRAAYESARKSTHGLAIPLFDESGDIKDLERMNNEIDAVDEKGSKVESPYVLTLDRNKLRFQSLPKAKQDTSAKFATQVCKTMKSMSIFDTDGSLKSMIDLMDLNLSELVKTNANRFYEEFGIDKEGNIKDLSKFVKRFKEEIVSRNLGDHFLPYLETVGEGVDMKFKYDIIYCPVYNKLESILTSAFNNSIMNFDMPGGTFVMASEEGFKRNINSSGIDHSKVLETSPDSKYSTENQLGENEVLISWCFEGPIPTQKELDKLLKRKDFQKLLTILGYRTPCQGPNSIGAFKIVGFLPPSTKATVICHKNTIVRMGCDFDVDKLYFYRQGHNSNYSVFKSKLETLEELRERRTKLIAKRNKLKEEYKHSRKKGEKATKEEFESSPVIKSLDEKLNKLRGRIAITKQQIELGNIDNSGSLKNRVLDNMIDIANRPEFVANQYLPNGPGPIHDIAGRIIKKLEKDEIKSSPYSSVSQAAAKFEGTTAKSGVSVFTSLMGGLMKLAYENTNFGNVAKNKEVLTNIQYFQSASVDNQKYGLLGKINVGNNTYAVITALLYNGHPIEEILAFINLPIVRELTDSMDPYILDRTKSKTKFIREFIESKGIKNIPNKDSLKSNYRADGKRIVLKEEEIEGLENINPNTNQEILFKFLALTEQGDEIVKEIGSKNIHGKGTGVGLGDAITLHSRSSEKETLKTIVGFDRALYDYGLDVLVKLSRSSSKGRISYNFDSMLYNLASNLGIADNKLKFFELKKQFRKFNLTMTSVSPTLYRDKLINKTIVNANGENVKNTTLAERIERLQNILGVSYTVNNQFLKRLSSNQRTKDPNKLHLLFDNTIGDSAFEVDSIVNDFLIFANDNFENLINRNLIDINELSKLLGYKVTADNKQYAYDALIKERNSVVTGLIYYSYLVDPEGPTSFQSYIPISLVEKYKILDNIKDVVIDERMMKVFAKQAILNDRSLTKVIDIDQALNHWSKDTIVETSLIEKDDKIVLPLFIRVRDKMDKSFLLEYVGNYYKVIHTYDGNDRFRKTDDYDWDTKSTSLLPLEVKQGGVTGQGTNTPTEGGKTTVGETTEQEINKKAKAEFKKIEISNKDFFNFVYNNLPDESIKKFIRVLTPKLIENYLKGITILQGEGNFDTFWGKVQPFIDPNTFTDGEVDIIRTHYISHVQNNTPFILRTNSGKVFIFTPKLENVKSVQILAGQLMEEILHSIDLATKRADISWLEQETIGGKFKQIPIDDYIDKVGSLAAQLRVVLDKLRPSLLNPNLQKDKAAAIALRETELNLLYSYIVALQEWKKERSKYSPAEIEQIEYTLSSFSEFKARSLSNPTTLNFLKTIDREAIRENKLKLANTAFKYLKNLVNTKYKYIIQSLDKLFRRSNLPFSNEKYLKGLTESLAYNYYIPLVNDRLANDEDKLVSGETSLFGSIPFNNEFNSGDIVKIEPDLDTIRTNINKYYRSIIKKEAEGGKETLQKLQLQEAINNIIATDNLDILRSTIEQEFSNIESYLGVEFNSDTERYVDNLLKSYNGLLKCYDDLITDEGKELIDHIESKLHNLERRFAEKKKKEVIAKLPSFTQGIAHRYLNEEGTDFLSESFKSINFMWAQILDISRIEHPLFQSLAEIGVKIKTESLKQVNKFQDEFKGKLEGLANYAKRTGNSVDSLLELMVRSDGNHLVDEIPEHIRKELNDLLVQLNDENIFNKALILEKIRKFKVDNFAVQLTSEEYSKLEELLGRLRHIDYNTFQSFQDSIGLVESNGNIRIRDEYSEGRYGKFLSILEELIEQHDVSNPADSLSMINTHIDSNDPITYMNNIISNNSDIVFEGNNFFQSCLKEGIAPDAKFEHIQSQPELKDFYNFYRKTLVTGRQHLPVIFERDRGILDTLYIPEAQSNELRKATNSFERGDILGSSKRVFNGMVEDFLQSVSSTDQEGNTISYYGFSQNRPEGYKEDLIESLVQFKIMSEQFRGKREYLHEALNIKDLISNSLPPGDKGNNAEAMVAYYIDAYFYGLTKQKNKIKIPKAKYYSPQERDEANRLKEEIAALNVDPVNNEKEIAFKQNRLDQLGSSYTISDLLDYLISWTRKIGLSFSTTLALTDMMAGFTCNQREAARGTKFNMKDLFFAYKEVLGENKGEFSAFFGSIALSGGIGPISALGSFVAHKVLSKQSGKVSKFANMLGIESRTSDATLFLKSEYVNDNMSSWKKLTNINKDDFFIMQQISGKLNALTTMVAYLKRKQIQYDDGTYVHTLNAYDILNDKGDLQIPEEELNNILEELTRECGDLIGNVHGNYDKDKPILLHKAMLGRVASLFKTWLWRGLEQRFSGYKVIRGEEFEGNYMTLFKYGYKSMLKGYRVFKHGEKGLSLPEIAKLFTYITILSPLDINKDSSWGNPLSTMEQENMRMAVTEIYQYLAVISFGTAVLMFAQAADLEDDDDENLSIPEKIMTNNLEKLYILSQKNQRELSLYVEWIELAKGVANPLPISRIATNLVELGDALKELSKAGAGFDHESLVIEKGAYKGQYKALRKLIELTPIVSGLARLDENGKSLKELREAIEKKEAKLEPGWFNGDVEQSIGR